MRTRVVSFFRLKLRSVARCAQGPLYLRTSDRVAATKLDECLSRDATIEIPTRCDTDRDDSRTAIDREERQICLSVLCASTRRAYVHICRRSCRNPVLTLTESNE